MNKMTPPLYEIVDALYKGATRFAPDWVTDRPMAAAAVLGFTGSYLVAQGVKAGLRKLGEKAHFDSSLLEKICGAAAPATLLAGMIIDHEGVRQILENHQVYTAGVTASAFGVFAGFSGYLDIGDIASGAKKAYTSLKDRL